MAPRFPHTAAGLVAFYNFMLADRKITMPPHLKPVCEGAMDPRIEKLLVTVAPGSGKSMLLSTMLPAFEIGHDPTLTQIGISAAEGLIQGFQRGVMELIADSIRWKAAFPDVVPDKLTGWSLDRGLFVKGHLPGDPDPNYAAFGVDSKKLTGVHARRITLDDIHDKDNGKTSEQCMAVRKIYYNTILGRSDPQGCRFIAAGRRWHPDDLYGHFAESGEWVHMNVPAIRDGPDLYWDITMPKGLDCCFSNY